MRSQGYVSLSSLLAATRSHSFNDIDDDIVGVMLSTIRTMNNAFSFDTTFFLLFVFVGVAHSVDISWIRLLCFAFDFAFCRRFGHLSAQRLFDQIFGVQGNEDCISSTSTSFHLHAI